MIFGVQATCYPSFMEKLPTDVVKSESRVQVDGKVVTSRGPGTAMEFGVALIELLYGKEKAEEVAGQMVIIFYAFVQFISCYLYSLCKVHACLGNTSNTHGW